MIQDANANIPRVTHFCWFSCLPYAFMCMFARLLWVARRTLVMHKDIHNPVCFLVAASQDRPGLGMGTPGNVAFVLLTPFFF